MSATAIESRSRTASPAAARATPRLELVHPKTEHVVRIPLGYHWAVAALGPIPLVLQRNWKLAAVTAVVTVCAPIIGQLVMGKFASRIHARQLIQKGYRGRGQQPGDVSAAEWVLGVTIPRLRTRV